MIQIMTLLQLITEDVANIHNILQKIIYIIYKNNIQNLIRVHQTNE
jgi:hypothetical protein